jgi:hypothetical protein
VNEEAKIDQSVCFRKVKIFLDCLSAGRNGLGDIFSFLRKVSPVFFTQKTQRLFAEHFFQNPAGRRLVFFSKKIINHSKALIEARPICTTREVPGLRPSY